MDVKTTWGIMGCAGIARKNIRAIQMSKGNVLQGIASRSLEKAKQFIKENNLDGSVTPYGSYDDLLNDKSIDAVYIPLPTTLHLEWARKTAQAKKHILLEKPVALNTSEFKAIVDECRENGVFLMDGVMFMHHTRTSCLRKILSDPFAGKVMRVNSSFAFFGDEEFLQNDIRCKAKGDPLGSLGDLSWYNIRLGIVAFSNGHDYSAYGQQSDGSNGKALFPLKVSARCNVWNDEGVPLDVEGLVWFGPRNSSDVDATSYLRFDSSFLLPLRQCYEISVSSLVKGVGEKVIRCNDFVISQTDLTAELSIESHPSQGPFANHASLITAITDKTNHSCCQEAEMFTNFAKYLTARKLNKPLDDLPSEEYWIQISIWTQATIDACFESMKLGGAVVPVSV